MFVDLSSRGPWYTSVIMAHAMLGHRGVRQGKMLYSEVEAQIMKNLWGSLDKSGKERVPSMQTVRNWEKDQPDYPEWAMRRGLISKEDLLPWAREYLNEEAQLSQVLERPYSQLKQSPLARNYQGIVIGVGSAPSSRPKQQGPLFDKASLGGFLLFMGTLWLASKLFEPQRQVLPFKESPGPRLLRGSRRRGFASGGERRH